MKVILNKDLAPLGEEGDIKDVARGYARNFLFPKNIAMPYTDRTVAILESRREAIEERKEEKRKDALGLKEKLEELELLVSMPAGANGRLYGAVTSQTVADELAKQGFEIERKRIELPGNSFKSVGKYKVQVKLYESASAELTVTVEGQQLKVETPTSPARRDRRRRDESSTGAADTQTTAPEAGAGDASADAVADAVADATAGTSAEASAATDVGVEANAAEVNAAAGAGAAADAVTGAPEGDGVVASAPEPVPEEGAVEA
jgi:large subunit ribosomal protein L9